MKPVTFPPAVTGDSGEQLLTVRKVADVLGLGPRTVRDYVARGELSGRLIRGRWRFGRKDIEGFLAMPPKCNAMEAVE
jgi:excisionase family DNA binding protein